jgi:hypothetical protein
MATEETTTTTTAAAANPYGALFEMWDQQMDRVDSMYEELGRRQAQATEQANRAMAELTKVAQDSLTFTTQLSQEWIKTARGTTRWASEIMGAWAR